MSTIATYTRQVRHTFNLTDFQTVESSWSKDKVTIERVVVRCGFGVSPVVMYYGRLVKRDGTPREYAAFKVVYPKVKQDNKWISEANRRAI